MTIFQRWKQTSLHNKALVLTGAIVALGTLVSTGAVIVQVLIIRANNRSTSEQINKIIEAAQTQAYAAQKIADASDRNATAAAKFAASAAGINQHTDSAVSKLKDLAAASQSAATTAKDTLNVSERAYLTAVMDTSILRSSGSIHIVMSNIGKIPSGRAEIVTHQVTLMAHIQKGKLKPSDLSKNHNG